MKKLLVLLVAAVMALGMALPFGLLGTPASAVPTITVEDFTWPNTHTKVGYYVAEIGTADPAPKAKLLPEKHRSWGALRSSLIYVNVSGTNYGPIP